MEIRSLSRVEARIVLSLEAEGRELVTLEEVRQRGGISQGFARKVAHGLVRKHWFQTVRRGVYLLNPSRRGSNALPDTDPLRLGANLVAPYYFGYGTAAQLLGLLSRAGPVYFVVSPVRTTFRPLGTAQFQLIHTAHSQFFGIRKLSRRGVTLRVSNVERTVIDCMERPELAGGIEGVGEVLAHAKPILHWDRLARYLARRGRRSTALRLGYLVELVRPDVPVPAGWSDRIRPRGDDPYAPLASPARYGRRGPRDPRWHIIENVGRRQLLGELDHR
ncbi:MAG: hypothetical protein L3K19_08155 [Thermoplasmata archaeon]|nr:hypothetical protein [Thermoplasmata archaeon]